MEPSLQTHDALIIAVMVDRRKSGVSVLMNGRLFPVDFAFNNDMPRGGGRGTNRRNDRQRVWN
jgi:hypothetical protein